MVSKAIDTGLIQRIRNYVANDINSKIVMPVRDEDLRIKPEEVYILSFERVLNHWQALATGTTDVSGFYRLVHDGAINKTIVTIYLQQSVQEAII